MVRVFFIVVIASFLTACTSQQAWNTAQVIKDLDCNYNSSIVYKRCDTRLEEEFQREQEQKRYLKEQEEKERAIQAALERSAPKKEAK